MNLIAVAQFMCWRNLVLKLINLLYIINLNYLLKLIKEVENVFSSKSKRW